MAKVIHWELCKKLKPDHSTKWYIHMFKPESVPREWDKQNSRGFKNTNRSLNPGQKTRPNDNLKKKAKKRTSNVGDFAVPVDHREKIKENEGR